MTPAPSVIRVMHRRYEETWASYNRLDGARPAKPDNPHHPDFNVVNAIDRGMGAIEAEQSALRIAIMHQVPTDWVDAMISSFTFTKPMTSCLN